MQCIVVFLKSNQSEYLHFLLNFWYRRYFRGVKIDFWPKFLLQPLHIWCDDSSWRVTEVFVKFEI